MREYALPKRAIAITQPTSTHSPATLPSGGATRAATIFVLVTVLLDVMALGMMLPALPKLVESFVPDNPILAAQLYGLFGVAWGLMQLFGSPFLGALSDQYGRRPIILLSNLGLGLDYLLMVFAPNLWVVLIGRLIAGLTSASFATAFAYIADVTPEDKRAAEFGKIGAAFGLGFIVGPALGGLLTSIDPRLPFVAAAAFSLANAAYGYFVLPESLSLDKRMPFTWARANPLSSLRLLGRTPRLKGLGVVSFLDSVALVSLPATFVLYVTHRFGWGDIAVGLTYASVGLGMAIVHGLLVGPVVERIGERRTLMVGLAFGAAGFTLFGLAPSTEIMLMAIPLIALWGFADASMQSLMTREVTPSEQGQLQGALASLMALAETVGPLLFSQAYALALTPGQVWLPLGIAFVLSGVAQLIGMAICWRVTVPRTVHETRRGQ
jgi:MFS transporter, DHA1 family, tetracycline resistance protein